MAAHPLAGKPMPAEQLVDIPRLLTAYYTITPDASQPEQRVAFGTSGHRGSSFKTSFNEDHILAVTQAICEYRAAQGITGPLFLGKDTHALSEPAFASAMEVLAANGIAVRYQQGLGYTPTPAVSRAILAYNRGRQSGLADGVVITPSHNPPQDGGFKYNPPHGGPADTEATGWIAKRANQLLEAGMAGVRRIPLARAMKTEGVEAYDFVSGYVDDLKNVLNLQAIRDAGLHVGADPLGGAAVQYWGPIAETYGLNLELVNQRVDPTFSFMPVDKDGVLRMDCSSLYAMSGMIGLKDRFDIAFGNDPDADRHGIVTRSSGLLNPNHYLAVVVGYLFETRTGWPKGAAVGKTVVTSHMLDRVAQGLNRKVVEVPVGFKWFVPGLLNGECGLGCEESAGASFLRFDGTAWSTDKDGILLNLLAAEMTAVTGKDPGQLYAGLTERYGAPLYERLEAPANAAQKKVLSKLDPAMVKSSSLAGEPIIAKQTTAAGNGAAIGGLKVVTENGWFAARPSGTEDIYKIYAESFRGRDHLESLKAEAKAMVDAAFAAAGV